MAEKETQKAIMDYLAIKRLFYWRNNTGAYASEYKGVRRYIRFGAPGSPDIFVIDDGKIYGIEVKSEKGVQNENQKEFQYNFENAGGIYILARSIDDIIKVWR